MADRVAVYFGTRNVYGMMVPAAKSLLAHTLVDRIYFMIEDKTFPDQIHLPNIIRVRNVSDQTYFPDTGPNYHTQYSWMCLMRAALPLLLPDEHVILSIDNDTLVRRDIGFLFDTDISDHYFAAVPERYSIHRKLYYNIGVALMNLDKLRNDGATQVLINNLNQYKYKWPEQDAFNDICRGHILTIPPQYNCAPAIIEGSDISTCSVRHYAGIPEKDTFRKDAYIYDMMSWKEVFRRQEVYAIECTRVDFPDPV